MKDDFKSAKHRLRTGNTQINVQAINGCCYGKTATPADKGDYSKLCGQDFWEFISGNDRLFVDIIEPFGYQAKIRNEELAIEYARVLNLFTQQFMNDFCIDGRIEWERLVHFNSGRPQPKSQR